MFKKAILKNGLRVIIVPQKGTEAVTVLVLVKTGSKYEQKRINGISHLLEHLLFKGTKKRPNHIAISEPLDRVGGIYNAFTGEEYTGYYVKTSSSHFDLALDIVSDIYLNSKLDTKEIKKEKGVVIEEMNMYFDHPLSYINFLWTKLLYGDQPAGWDIFGTKETVAGISREDIFSYMKSQYVGENTILCVAGNIPNKNQVVAQAKKYFSEIGTTKPFQKAEVIEKQKKPECLVHYKKTDQTHFCCGVRGYNIFHPKKYVQEVLGTILGGMMSSRLFGKIREEMGLAYYIHTSSSSDTDTGFLITQAGVDNQKSKKAITAVLKEYKKISKNKVSFSELKKAKENLKGKMALMLESSDAKASFYGTQELLKKEILSPKDIYKKIDKITADEVLRVAQDIFRPEKLNLALIGPFKDKNEFERILKI